MLIDGFIREIEQSSKNCIIPKIINSICFKFYYVLIDSLILNENEKIIFIELLNKSKRNISNNLKLVYRASRDGYTANVFHKKCNNMGKTICLIKTDINNIFGGYTPIEWTGKGGPKLNDKCFVFLIKSTKNYKPEIFDFDAVQSKQSIYDGSAYMCAFGGGCDIMIYSGCNKHSRSYTQQYSYKMPTKNYLNGGQRNFSVKEIEVYSVQ